MSDVARPGALPPDEDWNACTDPACADCGPRPGALPPDEDWNPALDPHHITRREASGGLAPGRGLERSSSVEEASEHAGVRGPCPRTRIGTAHRSSWPTNAKRRPGALPPDEDWNNSEPLVTWMGRSVRGPCPRTRIGTREHRHVNASGHEASGGLAPGRGLERHTRHRGGGRVQRRPGALPPDEDWNVDLPALPKVTPGVRGPCPRTRIGTVDEHQWPTRRVGRPGALPPDEDWNRHRAGTCAGRPRRMSGGLAPGRGLERRVAVREQAQHGRPGALPPDEDWNVALQFVNRRSTGVRGPCPRTRIGTWAHPCRCPARRWRPGALPPDEDWNVLPRALRTVHSAASGGLAPGRGLERVGARARRSTW